MRRMTWQMVGLAGLTALVFGLDIAFPLGVADAVAYIAVVLLALNYLQPKETLIWAGLCTFFILCEPFLPSSEPHRPDWMTLLANRLNAIFAIWVTASLGLTRRKTQEELKLIEQNLQAEMQGRKQDQAQASLALMKAAEQKKMTEEAQARLATVLEGTPDFVTIASSEGRVMYMNSAARQMMGLTAEDDVTRYNVAQFHPQEILSKLHNEVLPQAARDGSWRGELSLLRTDGVHLPVSTVVLTHRLPGGGNVECWSFVSRDISDQKRAALAVQSNEARIRALFEAALDAIVILDPQGKITEINKSAEKMFGYRRDEVLGREMSELLTSPEVAQRHRKNLAEFQDKQEQASMLGKRLEVPALRKNGEEFIAEMSTQPVQLEGAPPIFTVFLRDVTSRRKAENALQNSEALYHSLVDTLPMCILRKDKEGTFTFANKAYLELSKMELEDLVGKTDYDLYPKELARKYRDDDFKVMQAGCLFEDVESHQELNGELRYVQVIKTPVYDARGHTIGTQLFFWDVTDRHRAEEKLKDSEERFRQLAEHVREVFWITSADGQQMLYVSPAYLQIWGRTCEEIYAHPENWLEAIHPEDRQRVTNAFAKKAVTGEFDEEYRIVRPDGTLRWIRDRGFPVKNAAGEVYRITGIAEDITERKNADEEIRLKNRDLETLLYVTSHDLREPLRAIENFSRLVLDRYGPALDDKGKDFLQRVVRGAQRMDRLLEDVLTLSRAQRTVQPTDDVDLEEILQDVLRQLESRISRSQAKITLHAPFPRLRADKRWVTQAVLNLVGNALKFTPEGIHPEVEVSPYDRGMDGVGLVIRDRGPGVAPEHSERIFQLFQRAVGREVEGTGAGLAIVRQVAERHGGKVWVQPREGGGSDFTITFGPAPVSEPAEKKVELLN